MLSEIIESRIFPPDWNKFSIFFIPKKDSTKFRPISLAQCTLKLAERLLNNRLTWWLERNNILPNSQSGFRQNRSCMDNIAILYSDIYESWLNNKKTFALFLDINSAYDNVLWDILIDKLVALKLPPTFIKFIYNLTSVREVHFKYDDLDFIRYAYKGLPQGCVLSPSLYSIYVSDIERHTSQSPNMKILQYADDICLYTSQKNQIKAISELETVGNDVAHWFDSIGLSLAPNKSQFCIFSKTRNKLDRLRSLQIRNSTIQTELQVRFLGIIFSSNLKWNEQVNKILASCIKPLSTIKFLRSTWWGFDPKLLLMIYKSLVRSRIEYGSFIWFNIPQ